MHISSSVAYAGLIIPRDKGFTRRWRTSKLGNIDERLYTAATATMTTAQPELIIAGRGVFTIYCCLFRRRARWTSVDKLYSGKNARCNATDIKLPKKEIRLIRNPTAMFPRLVTRVVVLSSGIVSGRLEMRGASRRAYSCVSTNWFKRSAHPPTNCTTTTRQMRSDKSVYHGYSILSASLLQRQGLHIDRERGGGVDFKIIRLSRLSRAINSCSCTQNERDKCTFVYLDVPQLYQ